VRLGNLDDAHAVGSGIWELRIDYGPGDRVYYAQNGPAMLLLLCGGDKTAQAAPGECELGRPYVNYPKVFADFHNADAKGRLRLNCIGTVKDLAQQQIVLRDGLSLTLYSEELEVEGVVQYSTDENVWVAVIDWNAIRDCV
jgi:hypothetical protein